MKVHGLSRRAVWTGAGWLGVLCLFGAACVSVLLGAPGALLPAASGLAAGATVAFGSQFSHRRNWGNLAIAAVAGTAVLVCSAEAVWVATWFVPYAGGSGGFLAILAPLFIAVAAAVLALAALAVMLGAGVLPGMAMPGRPALRLLGALGMTLAAAGAAALASPATGQGGSFGVAVAPTRGNATGEWKGTRGAMLMLAPDGTFTASGLPAGMGGATPVRGSGTWHTGTADPSYPPGVIFDFSNGSQAQLQLETDGPSLAMYYDRGDPDEGWSGQYRFVKHQSASRPGAQPRPGERLHRLPDGANVA